MTVGQRQNTTDQDELTLSFCETAGSVTNVSKYLPDTSDYLMQRLETAREHRPRQVIGGKDLMWRGHKVTRAVDRWSR